jgi:hypothetical protein
MSKSVSDSKSDKRHGDAQTQVSQPRSSQAHNAPNRVLNLDLPESTKVGFAGRSFEKSYQPPQATPELSRFWYILPYLVAILGGIAIGLVGYLIFTLI